MRPDVLVLGGGGVLGEAWMRSCLAGLADAGGWEPGDCEAFVGTSAGSIVAAALAAGRRAAAAGGVAEAWEDAAAAAATAAPGAAPAGDDAGRDDNGRSRLAGALGGGAGRAARALAEPVAPAVAAGIAPARALARAGLLRARRPATREIPRLREALADLGAAFDGRLRVTAVDRASGRRVVFGAPGAPAADVVDAVLASCAVPWMFRPVEIGGRTYVDGGVWSAGNLDAAPVRRGSVVLCLLPTATPRLAGDRLGVMRGFTLATARSETLVLRRRGAAVRTVVPDPASVAAIGPSLFASDRRRAVSVAGYAQGRALAAGDAANP